MTRKYQIAYGALLIVVVLLLSFVLTPEQAYARYQAAVCWNTVVNMETDSLVTTPDPPILTKESGRLFVTLPEGVTNPECTIEVLSADQGFIAYHADNVMAVPTDNNTVIVVLGETLPPAGTYKLVVTWKTGEEEETAVIERADLTFFINYSGV